MRVCDIPMLARPTHIGRKKPNGIRRAVREGWSIEQATHRLPCPDCSGWISLNYDHDEDCSRIAYRKGRR